MSDYPFATVEPRTFKASNDDRRAEIHVRPNPVGSRLQIREGGSGVVSLDMIQALALRDMLNEILQ